MDRSTSTKNQTLKPARRKLQKCDPKLKAKMAKRGSSDSTVSSNTNYGLALRPSTSREMAPVGSINSPTPPDLSDSKWNHYLDNDNRPLTSPTAAPEPDFKDYKSYREPRKNAIPEFSHLTIHDAAARPSLDSSSIPSPASSTSTTSAMRRQAKTPVFRIGQLERPVFGRENEALDKTSSVDLIAEQYRALIDTRPTDTESVHDDSHLDRRPSYDALEVPNIYLPRKSSETTRSRTHLEPPRATDHLRLSSRQSPRLSLRQSTHQSPTSDDSELVAFEEDVIYFKPISFDPEPSPSLHHQSFGQEPSSSRFSSHDNLSLQICLDLLTRELSSAVADRPQRNGPSTAALQIWVMIEAYERLRDQVTRMGLHDQEMKRVELIFNSWLGALYSIHNTLTGAVPPSESEYDGLEEDLD
ncbi:Fc.00g061600.m01.CDS01 [Cosmosporella sp. VM-42]